MVKYAIKQKIVQEPEVELPEGSQVVSIKHHGTYSLETPRMRAPECWQVVWLEPIKK